MRTALLIVLLITHCLIHADTLTGRVVRVIDGDTIVVLDDSNAQHKVRLQGIDAPESGQAYGTKSKKHISSLVAGEYTVIIYGKLDRYLRLVGKVLLDGRDINLEQIKAGLAWHYKKYQGEQSIDDRVKYSDAESDARENMRGLWNDPHPTPPWDYRHDQRSGTIPLVSQPIKSGFTCGSKNLCREMTSCKEAKFYLNECGLSRLDGDNDGVPCENICRLNQ